MKFKGLIGEGMIGESGLQPETEVIDARFVFPHAGMSDIADGETVRGLGDEVDSIGTATQQLFFFDTDDKSIKLTQERSSKFAVERDTCTGVDPPSCSNCNCTSY